MRFVDSRLTQKFSVAVLFISRLNCTISEKKCIWGVYAFSGVKLVRMLPAVPVFMPVPFEVHPGDACLVVFADADIDGWLETGEPQESKSARKHSLSDGFAFVGWRTCPNL